MPRRKPNKAIAPVLAFLFVFVALVGNRPVYAADLLADITVDKTATELNDELETTVNLTFPGKEQDLSADVVFVLDKSGASAHTAIFDQAKAFVADLSEQAIQKDIEIKIGVVLFNSVGNVVLGLTDVRTGKDQIIDAMNRSVAMGTNLHAGLLAGKKMLDDDTSVMDSHKHMVVMSDGATYLWCKNDDYSKGYTRSFGDPTQQGFSGSSIRDRQGGIWEYTSRDYCVNTVSEKWNATVSDSTNLNEKLTARLKEARERNADYEQYDYEYNLMSVYLNMGRKVTPITPEAIANIEVAHFKVVDCFDEIDAKYNTWCYYIDVADYNGSYLLNYMKRNSGGLSTDFADIQKQILNLVSEGSVVEDLIGDDFDFVNDVSKIHLHVGDSKLVITKLTETRYGFGEPVDDKYRFELAYEEAPVEKLILSVNENVLPSAPVNLQYAEKLVNVPTNPGTYSFDTNESAELDVVDEGGTNLGKIPFPKPTVTYELGKVIARYVDIDTGDEIETSVEQYGRTGATYRTDQKEIDEYVFVKDSGNTTGLFTNGEIEVVYSYKKVEPVVDDPDPNPDVPADPLTPIPVVTNTPPKSAAPIRVKGAGTGDSTGMYGWIMLFLFSTTAVVLLHKRRRK